jgi:hypothetical protein
VLLGYYYIMRGVGGPARPGPGFLSLGYFSGPGGLGALQGLGDLAE